MKICLKVLFAAALLLQLRASAETARSSHASVQHVIFVDQSASPGAGDAERWVEAANRKVFEPLKSGDSLIIYAVHDHTAESAPLLEVALPPLNPDAGMEEVVRARRALRNARDKGAETVRMAVHSAVRSRTTRLIESLRRIHTDPHRVTEVLFLSDMLESTRELDLERTRLTSANLVGLAQSAFERYGLSRGFLDGVTVYCVLDSPPIGGSVKVNDRETLERFWRLILTSAGANLAGFDSRIQ